MPKNYDLRSAFDVMYQNDFNTYADSRSELYNKIRVFCYRNGIQFETRQIPRRAIDVGNGGYGVHSKYEYVTDYPEFDLTMKFELLAKIVCDLEEMDMYVRLKEKEAELLASNPELAEMHEKYLTFKALCEQKTVDNPGR